MNGRNAKRKQNRYSGREPGPFFAITVSVMQSSAYLALSHAARSLLLEIALQFKGDNNGRLLASKAHLSKRGWNSADVIQRAKAQLIESQLIFETVKGARPNRASWYAITWQSLDPHPDYDPGVTKVFARSMYQKTEALTPARGTPAPSVVPAHGTKASPPTPSAGPMAALH